MTASPTPPQTLPNKWRPWRRVTLPRWLRIALRVVERALALVGLASIIYVFCFDLSRIVSNSMWPTLQGTNIKNGDLVLSEKISWWLHKPRRWELVMFLTDEGLHYTKRIVGLPGENVTMQADGIVEIDGEKQIAPDGVPVRKYLRFGNLLHNKPIPCNDGYYLLGDETKDSDDSRFSGPVEPWRLLGRPWIIVAPRERMRFLNP